MLAASCSCSTSYFPDGNLHGKLLAAVFYDGLSTKNSWEIHNWLLRLVGDWRGCCDPGGRIWGNTSWTVWLDAIDWKLAVEFVVGKSP